MTSKDGKIFGALIAAEKLLSEYSLKHPCQIKLEDLAAMRNVYVIEGSLKGAEARLFRKGGSGIIRVKRGIPEIGRKRFAIAHELGHWERHGNISQLSYCLEEDIQCYKGSIEELEANAFAGGLLAPTGYIRSNYKSTPSIKLIKEVAEDLQTSLTMSAVRIVETTRESIMVVFSKNGKVHWWKASPAAPSVWLESGQDISHLSVTWSHFRQNQRLDKSEKVNPEAWFKHIPFKQHLTVYEEAIRLGRYDTILTILRIERWEGNFF